MNEIAYVNEHAFIGQLGHFAVALAFGSALFSFVAYFLNTKNKQVEFIRLGRYGYYTHAISVITIVFALFMILFNHYFEYDYAHDHLNSEMPMKYVFSCMWEGQEGSFLLWLFWQMVLGFIVLKRSKEWEPYVMAVIALVQVFLSSMLLGVYIGDFQFGSSPFLLVRETAMNVGLPWTEQANYMSLPQLQNGKGLNPLLQNYWMTIHPPTLFLGFASTLIPFSFAIAGLMKGDRTGWMKPAIPWAFFGVMILGTGILMGGAWAYEALGFGGFWAWDPVENASLVPWLTLVASAHLLVINKRKPTSVFATFILTLSSFVLIVYSTFLTRSGVLGDSSVHSFVDSGILAQLLVYLLVFIFVSTYFLENTTRWKKIYLYSSIALLIIGVGHVWFGNFETNSTKELLPGEGTWIPGMCFIFLLISFLYLITSYRNKYAIQKSDEEALLSREFWMFLGSLVLSLSAIHITFVTSINVWNIFLTPFEGFFMWLHQVTGNGFMKELAQHQFSAASGDERFTTFHQIQVPLAIILLAIISISQWLKYKQTETKKFLFSLVMGMALAGIVTLLFIQTQATYSVPLGLLFFASMWALFSNAEYAVRVLKGKFNVLGASIAHMGFAMLLLGALISTGSSYFISRNVNGDIRSMSKEFNNNEDLLLIQGDTLQMGDYLVSFRDKRKEGSHIVTSVDYFEIIPKSYIAGQKVIMNDGIFICLKNHTSTGDFFEDAYEMKHWSPLSIPSDQDYAEASLWRGGQPGKLVFTLEPSVLLSMKGNSREPSIQHGLGEDLYTYIKYIDIEEKKFDEDGFAEAKNMMITPLTPVKITETLTMKLDSMYTITELPDNLPAGTSAKRSLLYLEEGAKRDTLEMIAVSVNGEFFPTEVESELFHRRFSVFDTPDGIQLSMREHKSAQKEILILSAEIFPMINLLWLGCIIMVIGTVLAIRHRIQMNKKKGA